MNVLEISKLYKRYNSFSLDDVSFELGAGEVVGLIGRNGAGKTTLISSIMNPGIKDGGEIDFFGKSYDNSSKQIKDKIGFVQDMMYFFREFNSKDISIIMKNFYSAWEEDKYYKLLKKLDVESSKRIKDYSRGMKTKLQLAIALSHNAEILILDEVTSGLDPIARRAVKDILREYANNGVSILFSTHIVSDLKNLANRIILIDDGRVVFNETVSLLTQKNPVIIKNDEELSDIPDRWVKLGLKNGGKHVLILNFEYKYEYKDENLHYPDLEELMGMMVKESL